MEDLSNKTLSKIVTEHHQTARVFENYGLDFCCRGRRPLKDACEEKGVPLEKVLEELYEVVMIDEHEADFDKMSLTELAEYIVRVHHSYTTLNMPQIINYVGRVAAKHGDKYPFMEEVYVLFSELSREMIEHMVKEEKILFPRIKLLEMNAAENQNVHSIQSPIHMMESEHDHAGAVMQKIKELTNNYTAPEQACTTFHLALESLKAFDQDLHQHVHLENNILFPKAIELFTRPASCSLVR